MFSFWRHDLSRLASVPLLRRSTQIMREHLSMNRSLPAMLGHQQTGRISGDHFRDRLVTTRCSDLNLSEFQDCHVVPHSSAINAIHLDNCDYRYLLAGASDGTLYIHDVQNLSGSPRHTSDVVAHVSRSNSNRHSGSVECVSWYPDDHEIFLTSGSDKVLKVWDANQLTPADQFKFEGKVYSHDISEIGSHNMVAVGTTVNHVSLVDLRAGANIHHLRGHTDSVVVCKWSNRDENLLATGGRDGVIYLWDVRRGKSCLRRLDYNNLRSNKRRKRKLDDDQRKKRNCDKVVSHDGMVNGIVFAPDGQYLVSFGRDKKLRKWSVDKGENMKAAFPMINNERRTNAQMCMGDKFLFVPSDTKIHVLDIETFSPVKSLGGHYNNVNCVTFNKAFQEMYSGGNDRNILVWEPNLSRTEAYHDHLAAEDKEQALSGRRRSLANTVTVDNWSSDDSD